MKAAFTILLTLGVLWASSAVHVQSYVGGVSIWRVNESGSMVNQISTTTNITTISIGSPERLLMDRHAQVLVSINDTAGVWLKTENKRDTFSYQQLLAIYEHSIGWNAQLGDIIAKVLHPHEEDKDGPAAQFMGIIAADVRQLPLAGGEVFPISGIALAMEDFTFHWTAAGRYKFVLKVLKEKNSGVTILEKELSDTFYQPSKTELKSFPKGVEVYWCVSADGSIDPHNMATFKLVDKATLRETEQKNKNLFSDKRLSGVALALSKAAYYESTGEWSLAKKYYRQAAKARGRNDYVRNCYVLFLQKYQSSKENL